MADGRRPSISGREIEQIVPNSFRPNIHSHHRWSKKEDTRKEE